MSAPACQVRSSMLYLVGLRSPLLIRPVLKLVTVLRVTWPSSSWTRYVRPFIIMVLVVCMWVFKHNQNVFNILSRTRGTTATMRHSLTRIRAKTLKYIRILYKISLYSVARRIVCVVALILSQRRQRNSQQQHYRPVHVYVVTRL
jgi:hypothetical protein